MKEYYALVDYSTKEFITLLDLRVRLDTTPLIFDNEPEAEAFLNTYKEAFKRSAVQLIIIQKIYKP